MAGNYCALSDVKAYLSITGPDWDALITSIIPRTSRFIDTYTDIPQGWDQATLTETLPGVIDVNGYLSVMAGKPVVQSVSSLSLTYDPRAAAVTADTAGIQLDPNGRVWSLAPSWYGYRTYSRLRVTINYTGGYNPLPDDVTHAAIVLTARMYKAKDAGWSDAVGSDQMGMLIYSKVMPREIAAILNQRKRVALM